MLNLLICITLQCACKASQGNLVVSSWNCLTSLWGMQCTCQKLTVKRAIVHNITNYLHESITKMSPNWDTILLWSHVQSAWKQWPVKIQSLWAMISFTTYSCAILEPVTSFHLFSFKTIVTNRTQHIPPNQINKNIHCSVLYRNMAWLGLWTCISLLL